MDELNPEIEKEARDTGWVPQDEFKGDPDRWTPAEDWVERGRTIIPIMRAQIKGFQKDLKERDENLSATKKEIESLRETMQKVIETTSKISEQEYQRAMDTLKKQQIEAVGNADAEAYQRIEEEKTALEGKKVEKIDLPESKPEPTDVSKWKSENSWFTQKPTLGAYAASLESFVASQNKGKSVYEILNIVTEEVKKRFPEEFENPNKTKPSAVDDTTLSGASNGNGKKGYRDLPKEAKDACDEMCRTIPGMTKEKYVTLYPW